MTKQRKRENGATNSVKAQVTVWPCMNFAEGIVLTRFFTRMIII